MPVIRVEKNKNYTAMSNYHLKDKRLSLKAKGLLSMILSLPDKWDYSVRGLASICKEGKDSIARTLRELEEFGYVCREQARAQGRFAKIEYVVFEHPDFNTYLNCGEADTSCSADSYTADPGTESPCTENPNTVNEDGNKVKKESKTKRKSTKTIKYFLNQEADGQTDTRLKDLVNYFSQVFHASPSKQLAAAMKDALKAGLTYGAVQQAIDDAAARQPDHPSAYTATLVKDYIQRGGAPTLSPANQQSHLDDPLADWERDWLEEFNATRQ
ncbi:helix-turn-helix domain-containing protein [Butyricicoccus porcorum]|uniref:Helix-turn-helix domain-containing protein n=1 Tax=Butyricicoccus porcorum TaxID=1945634 RepID=A0A252F197_9FIRM|nr:helix-turn-helix domain-containing protein [Butyricicoccus porcorum]OUM19586.1 hypothetical protein CBW42_12460 [Butyricicoccus porcorum]